MLSNVMVTNQMNHQLQTEQSLPFEQIIALNPVWTKQDFAFRVSQIAEQLKQDGVQSAALWFADAAKQACAVLACFEANVNVLLVPNLLEDNQIWLAENSQLFLDDAAFESYGIKRAGQNKKVFWMPSQIQEQDFILLS